MTDFVYGVWLALMGLDFGGSVWLEMAADNGFVLVAWVFHGFSLKIVWEGERGTNFCLFGFTVNDFELFMENFIFVKFLLVDSWCNRILTFYFK